MTHTTLEDSLRCGLVGNLRILGALVLFQIVAFQLHETGHYLFGRFMGLELVYEYAYVTNLSENASNSRLFVLALGGPFVTFSLAATSILLSFKKIAPTAFLLFGYANVVLRLRAMLNCLLQRQPHQDECSMASIVNLPTFSLAWLSLALSVGFLAALVYRTPSGRPKVLLYALVASFLGPGVVMFLLPILPSLGR